MSRLTFFLLSVIYLIGLWLSDTLILEHISFKLGDLTDSGLCGAAEVFSCKAAAASVYSNIFGLPIAAIGEAYYLTALLVLLSARLSERFWTKSLTSTDKETYRHPSTFVLGGAATLSALYSLFLGVVSALDLGFLCPLCIGLYVVNIASFILLWRGGGVRLSGWRSVWRTWTPWLVIFLMGASVIAAQGAYAIRYNKAYKVIKKSKRAKKPPKHFKVKVGSSPVRGEFTAVTIVEFSDFQCPYCRRLSQRLKKAQEEKSEYPFRYVFKHYPLSTICNPYSSRDLHPRACYAGFAAVCAEKQGRFWEMHDLLFKNQKAQEDEDLKRYAEEIGLDMSRFEHCLTQPDTAQRILSDIEEGHAVRVGGTPAFFVNGWRFSGAVGLKKLKEIIKEYGYGVRPEPKEEDSNAKEGESNAKEGDPKTKEGDSNAKEGESNAKEGDSNAKEGDSNAKEGDPKTKEEKVAPPSNPSVQPTSEDTH